MQTEFTQRHIPTMAEIAKLHHDPQAAFKNDKLLILLNQPPHESYIKKHPIFKVKDDNGKDVAARYVPIDKVEFLLTYIFGQWYPEILREGYMFNSVYVVVRLHYRHPITGEWLYVDGIGVKELQLDSGAKASDLSAIKGTAVVIALPIAKSAAIKDAADHIGNIFGGNLNRRDVLMYSGGIYDVEMPGIEQPKIEDKKEEKNTFIL